MFPRSSFVMVLVAGVLLLIASLINKLNGAEVNKFYLITGILFAIFGVAMLIFKKSK